MHLCEVQTERDVDWAVNRVLLGDRVVAHVGGLHRLRRHRLKPEVALSCLEARIRGLGGQMQLGHSANALGRVARGRTALLLPPEDDDGDFGGVREPRRPTPEPSTILATVPLPGSAETQQT